MNFLQKKASNPNPNTKNIKEKPRICWPFKIEKVFEIVNKVIRFEITFLSQI